MNLSFRVETWLTDYAEWRNAPPPNLRVNGSTNHEIIDGVVCRPDGGMARFVQMHERLMRMERTARAVEDALPYLPKPLREAFDATYVGEAQHVPRSERDAAAMLGVSLTKYQKLKFGLLCFFQGMNFQAMAVPEYDKDVSTTKPKQKGDKR